MRLVMPNSLPGFAAVCLIAALVRAEPDVTLCGQYENVTDPSDTYRLSTNVWGRDSSGASCVDVTDNATVLSSTWSWSANDTLVHAYPNINFNPVQRDPIQISNLSSIDVKVSWSMKPTMSTSKSAFDMDGLAVVNAKTNVAFDFFFDTDIENAVNTTAPKYEVMVWIGKFGSILPIGASDNGQTSKLPTQNIGKEKFTLYQGANDNGQQVFSWLSNSNKTEFEGDLSPLVHYLWRHGFVLAANYIGVIQFGTEQKHATSNITFSVDEFSIGATRGTPKAAAGFTIKLPRVEFICVLAVMVVLGTL
ncbi:glycoside hydrolase family 12 protein [Dothidotthia symphoricarpi CBS 119687]|uniref:Glycoside hydrolase family 12 protein n=1 Tax=Dothidotthia symphoricarpi CBS 119687 TaxID=1392245 RepID=A0A6A6AS27_9PLEO|nr:glycoside hydrolase family 12 protein [Dothidotthia symphoricarpi CBS 119687]KAF2134356.1 glycoside hydrolase family 12 protein [Dothidotthia symphoricarpi CBS 119687]